MKTRVTLSIFSGRPNPQYILSGEQEKGLRSLLNKLKAGDRRRVVDVCPDGFGLFRVVREKEDTCKEFICGGGLVEFPMQHFTYPDSAGIAQFLLDACPDELITTELRNDLSAFFLMKHPKFRSVPMETRMYPCAPNPSSDAQPYDESWSGGGWNGNPYSYNHMFCNNCYDYVNNQQTDTYSQPGYGSGQIFTYYNCGEILQPYNPINTVGGAAVRDGLVKVKNCTDLLGPGQGWYVALLLGKISDMDDFHWVKQDKSGCWSHKLGDTSVKDYDSNLQKITSPEDAVFKYGLLYIGNNTSKYIMRYTTFCGYYRTNANVQIKGIASPNNCWDWGW